MKQILTLLMTFLFACAAVMPGYVSAAAPQTAQEKIVAMEKFLYGTEQAGALIARSDSIEVDVYGIKSTETVLNKVDNLYTYLFSGKDSSTLSFAAKLNAAEWQFIQTMSQAPAKTRLETLEETLYGKMATGKSLSGRLDELTALAFPDNQLKLLSVVVPKDTLVKIAFTEDLNSKQNRAGDAVHFKVEDNVFVGNALVIPKGAIGTGTVEKIVQNRSFGRDARIDVAFTGVRGIDNSEIPVFVGDLAKQEAKTVAGAAGAAIGGMIILGPIGALGGAFVTGKSVNIPPGSITYVQLSSDTTIEGLVLSDGSAVHLTDTVQNDTAVVDSSGTQKVTTSTTESGTLPYDVWDPGANS